eukprot:TRINITY_DN23669_c0_g1_i1.p1 TRINITY_DN23669_c0_g1~~TRINITY_DN23669_c0_g1_i1.p1  ORF type:complete len:860 (-),score=179.05 TRINITY_DN23669_c0_g1_i1:13-2571(-)
MAASVMPSVESMGIESSSSGGLSASANFAASLATAGISFPWPGQSPGSAYPLTAPPGQRRTAGPPASAQPGSAGRWAAAAGFQGLFQAAPPVSDGISESEQADFWCRLQPVIGRAIEATPAGRATAVSSSSTGAALSTEGSLRVRVQAAHGLRNTDTGLFGDLSDPYVVVRAGGREHRTPTIDDDLDPVWSDGNDFTFPAPATLRSLELEVYNENNENIRRDDSLGKAVLSVPDLRPGVWHRRRVSLEKGAGAELSFEVFVISGESEVQTSKTMPAATSKTVPASYGSSLFGRNAGCSSPAPGAYARKSSGLSLPPDWSDVEENEDDDDDDQAIPSGLAQRPRHGSTFSAPEDLFGDARLEIGDPTAGPAYTWQRAFGSRPSSSSPWPGNTGHLACLTESLQLRAKQSQRAPGAQDSADDALKDADEAAFSRARQKETAAKKAAQDELQKTLRRLQELDAAAQKPSVSLQATASEVPKSPGPPPPVTQTPSFDRIPPLGATQASSSSSSSSQAGGLAFAAASAPPVAPTSGESFSKAAPSVPPSTQAVATPAAPTKSLLQERYQEAIARLEKVEQELEPFKKDAAHKDFRLQAKKAMNTRVGQISATWSRIQECTSGLCSLLDEYMKDPNPLRQSFAKYAMAMRLADDAEVGVRAQPRAAWSIAEVACRIFDKFPAIQDIFTGIMCRNCPYLRPDYTGSQVGRAGPAAGQNSGEAFTEFADRMVSYHRLWLAIVVTQGELGILWNWFARTLNEPPCPISAPMVHAALDAVGADAQARYGKQFTKLVSYIGNDYMAELEALQQKTKGEEADRLRASHARLRRWLDDFRSTGRAKPPEGRYVEARQESELNPNI